MPSLPSIPNFLPKLAQGEYPLPAFFFSIEWKDGETQVEGSFTEVSGLNQEIQLLEYRDGAAGSLSTFKIPGMKKEANVTMKRGIFHGKNNLYEWWDKVKNLAEKDARTVTINLLTLDDNQKKIVVTWTLTNAWPLKIEGPSLKGDGNDIAVETMELVHEGMKMEHPKT